MPLKLGQLALLALSHKAALVKIALVTGSALYQRRVQRKLRDQARDAAAISYTYTGAAQPLPVIFGRAAVDPAMAYPPDIKSSWSTAASGAHTAKGVFGSLRPGKGETREYQMTQWAISAGYIHRVFGLTIDGIAHSNSRINRLIYAHVHADGQASPVATAYNPARRTANAKATGIAALTLIQKHQRDKPEFAGPPRLRVFAEGKMARMVERTGVGQYALGDYTNSPNAIANRLGFMTNARFGPGIDPDDLVLETWFEAQEIAGQFVQGNQAAWDKTYPPGFNAEDGTAFDTYADLFQEFGLTGPSDPGLRVGAYGNPAGAAAGPLMRYELNGALRGDLPFNDALAAIDAHIPGLLTWTDGSGLIRCDLPDPDAAAPASVLTVEAGDLPGDIAIADPSAERDNRVNRGLANFLALNKDFTPSQAIYPAPGGALDTSLLATDGGVRVSEEYQFPFAATEYHARDLAATRVHLSRRRMLRLPAGPEGALAEPGSIISLGSSILGQPVRFRVLRSLANENLELALDLVEHDPLDYAWRGAPKDERAPAQASETDYTPAPVIPPTPSPVWQEAVLRTDGAQQGLAVEFHRRENDPAFPPVALRGRRDGEGVAIEPATSYPEGVEVEITGAGTERAEAIITHAATGAEARMAWNIEDEPPDAPTRVEIVTGSDLIVLKEGGSADVSIRLSAQPREAVTVTATGNGVPSEGLTITGSPLSFTGDNWNTAQAVTVTADISADENDRRRAVWLGSASPGVRGKQVQFLIQDQGRLALAVESYGPIRVNEGASVTIRAKLTARPPSAVTITAALESDRITTPTAERTIQPADFDAYVEWEITAAENTGRDDSDFQRVRLTASGGLVETADVGVVVIDQTPPYVPPSNAAAAPSIAAAWINPGALRLFVLNPDLNGGKLTRYEIEAEVQAGDGFRAAGDFHCWPWSHNPDSQTGRVAESGSYRYQMLSAGWSRTPPRTERVRCRVRVRTYPAGVTNPNRENSVAVAGSVLSAPSDWIWAAPGEWSGRPLVNLSGRIHPRRIAPQVTVGEGESAAVTAAIWPPEGDAVRNLAITVDPPLASVDPATISTDTLTFSITGLPAEISTTLTAGSGYEADEDVLVLFEDPADEAIGKRPALVRLRPDTAPPDKPQHLILAPGAGAVRASYALPAPGGAPITSLDFQVQIRPGGYRLQPTEEQAAVRDVTVQGTGTARGRVYIGGWPETGILTADVGSDLPHGGGHIRDIGFGTSRFIYQARFRAVSARGKGAWSEWADGPDGLQQTFSATRIYPATAHVPDLPTVTAEIHGFSPDRAIYVTVVTADRGGLAASAEVEISLNEGPWINALGSYLTVRDGQSTPPPTPEMTITSPSPVALILGSTNAFATLFGRADLKIWTCYTSPVSLRFRARARNGLGVTDWTEPTTALSFAHP